MQLFPDIPVTLVAYSLGVLHAVQAVLHMRTSQGAIAWALCLILFPYVFVPLYWLFGPRKFLSYREHLIHAEKSHRTRMQQELVKSQTFRTELPEALRDDQRFLERLAAWPFTSGNALKVLIDGEQTFQTILSEIEAANDYVLLGFYIVRDDQIGRELKALLKKKASQGIKILFLIDQIGSWSLPQSYIDDLRHSRINFEVFRTTKIHKNRFQLNFRNHRKIVVVDGKKAIVGGQNVGDEYLGRDPEFGEWRDTAILAEGPVVQGVQRTFAADWYWATGDLPDLCWNPTPSTSHNMQVLPIATGAADEYESCTLFFLDLIQIAQKRIWLASPYFVPDTSILDALQLAALRGVDVRLLLPDKADYPVVHLVGMTYVDELLQSGVKVFLYEQGFMHQKVVLVDDALSAVGTANLDNRSLRLNFELMLLCHDSGFALELEKMLDRDFARSRTYGQQDTAKHSMFRHFAARFFRLFSPIL